MQSMQEYLQRHTDQKLFLLLVDLPVVQEQLKVTLVEAQHAVQLHVSVTLVHEVV